MLALTKWFVNRQYEIGLALKMLELGQLPYIFLIEAPGGMGKSWLVRRYSQLCRDRATTFALIDFNTSQTYDYLAIMNEIAVAFNEFEFSRFKTALNNNSRPTIRIDIQSQNAGDESNVQILDSSIQYSQISNLAGRDILNITGNYFVLNQSEGGVRSDIRRTTTNSFMADLIEIDTGFDKPMVWLFDSMEKAGIETINWIMEELLKRILDGKLNKQRIVLCGREIPKLSSEWWGLAETVSLNGLAIDDFKEYFEKRGVEANSETVEFLHKGLHGNPQKLATLLDGYARNE